MRFIQIYLGRLFFLGLPLLSLPSGAEPVNLLKSWHNAPPSNPKGDKASSMSEEESQADARSMEEEVVVDGDPESGEDIATLEAQAAEPAPVESPSPVVQINPIQVEVVEPVQAENVGLLDEESGGLPRDIWKGASLKEIEAQLSQLPVQYQNHAFYQLALRLLLSAFEFPKDTKDHNLIKIRVQKLLAMGHAKEAHQLIQYDKKSEDLDLKNKVHYEKLLHEGDFEMAAKLAESSFASHPNLYWEKAVIFCKLQNNNLDQARLSLSLFEEANTATEQPFIDMVRSILEETKYTPSPLPMHQMNFQDLLLLSEAKDGLTPEDLETIKPAYVPIVLQHAEKLKIPYETQLRLWENLCDFAPKYMEDLRKIYAKVPVDQLESIKKELQNIEQDKSILLKDSPLVRACLFQIFETTVMPASKLNLAEELMRNGIQNNKLNIVAALLAPSIAKITPSKERAAWGPIAITSLSLSEHKKEAKYWCDYTQDVSNPSYVPFILGTCGSKPEDLEKTLTLLEKELGQAAQLAYTYLILEEMGVAIPHEHWDHIADTSLGSIPLSQKRAIKAAAKEKRTGETLAYILKISGSDKAALNPESVQMILSALKEVGLVNDAQNMSLWYLARRN